MIRPKAPAYRGTTVEPERTWSQIQKLLLDSGCEAVSIMHEASGRVVVRFAIEVEVRGVRRKIGVEVEPPILTKATVQNHYRVQIPDVARSARLAYWYLKTKLEAVQFGLVTAEREFLAQVMVALPDGSTGTVGDTVDDSLDRGSGFFLPGLQERKFALPPPKGGA